MLQKDLLLEPCKLDSVHTMVRGSTVYWCVQGLHRSACSSLRQPCRRLLAC